MIRCPDLTRRILAPVTTGSHCRDSRSNSMQVAARSVQCSLVWNRLLLLFLGGPIFPDGIGSASMSGALDKANKDQEASVPGFPKVGFGAGLSAFLITTLARRICQHTRTYCRCTDGTRGAKPLHPCDASLGSSLGVLLSLRTCAPSLLRLQGSRVRHPLANVFHLSVKCTDAQCVANA